MASGRLREEWNQTSQILAVLINSNRKKGSPAVRPRQLNPYTAREIKRRPFDIAATAKELGTEVFVSG